MAVVTTLQTSPKPDVDWEAVSRDYRLGQLSLREIGKLHGISHSLIIQKAKKEGWTRDLSEALQQRVKAKLNTQISESEGLIEGTDEEITETVAKVVARVLGAHRNEAKALRQIAATLRMNLAGLMTNQRPTPAQIKQRADLLASLTRTTKEIVMMERESYDIANHNETEKKPLDIRDRTELARQLAFALRSGVEAMKDGKAA